jgi:hypothetical protein
MACLTDHNHKYKTCPAKGKDDEKGFAEAGVFLPG